MDFQKKLQGEIKKNTLKWFYSTRITNFRYEGEEEAIKKFSREKLTLRCRHTSCRQNIMYEKCGTLLFYQIELLKMGLLQFCLPVLIGIHRNLK